MDRRNFMQRMLGLGTASSFHLPLARGEAHSGKLFVFVQATGGWDPTSFCDPKVNVRGERAINTWAENAEIRQAGNIAYAPFAANAAFFEKYWQRMLVVNGVDAQTNSHDVGVIHNWSGRISEGYPTTTALLAAQYGSGLSMPYISFGGYSNPAGLAVYTRLGDPQSLQSILAPDAATQADDPPYINQEDWKLLQRYRMARAERMASAAHLLPRSARSRIQHLEAISPDSTSGLRRFSGIISSERQIEETESNGKFHSTLKRQAQLAVLAFKAGVAVSADLALDGFDTHETHDEDHTWLLANLTDSIDFLWDYAEAHGVADRLLVVIGSDFGRTNFYNDNLGKDHWPIGSFVIMEKNQPWTNRVVGETDPLHFGFSVNAETLQRDDLNGLMIHPKHVHKALRKYMGIENSSGSLQFPFDRTELLPLFG